MRSDMFIYQKVIDNPDEYSFEIESLGECTIDNPIKRSEYVSDDDKIVFPSQLKNIIKLANHKNFPAFQKAGPRAKIFHDPNWSKAAIVTCGGLCPGLNDVIKGLVKVLECDYKIKTIYGIRYGYRGLNPRYKHEPMLLTSENVDNIHERGGSILGSSRGSQPVDVMVDTLIRKDINILFCIGGDGTLKGAKAIWEEAKRRSLSISVIGIPKTIDNDISFVERSFGFETAVYRTFDVISSAHNEAEGAYNGISIIKLMGRDSGFIAASATLANSVVDICLIPEVDFDMEGENGLKKAVVRCLEKNGHCVIVVAEGAGQKFFGGEKEFDASGNIKHKDIGVFIRDEISNYLKELKIDFSLKYFDPSYMIRSSPAQGTDAIFCLLLAENAVHAAMAGKTNCLIGTWNNFFTHVPISLAVIERRKIHPEEALYKAMLSATRQEEYFYPQKD
ncbi:MAG: ATP-dependent 6-phosphofructokinase [Deltaproteobacteria bacterium]|nr:ATP-dependent 6-phosphofructokinase [Deltaproteobacteria bacterium]